MERMMVCQQAFHYQGLTLAATSKTVTCAVSDSAIAHLRARKFYQDFWGVLVKKPYASRTELPDSRMATFLCNDNPTKANSAGSAELLLTSQTCLFKRD